MIHNSKSIKKFGKQFLIHRDYSIPRAFSEWKKLELVDGYILETHPDLAISAASSNDNQVIVLGDIFDPSAPEKTNEQIVETLLQRCSSFSDLEAFVAPLGGRWILATTMYGKTRLYHDAMGLKPIFYMQSDRGLLVGSQPVLLEAIGATEFDPTLGEIFTNYDHPPTHWPINTIPYKGVTQLLPNHTLNLQTGSIERYWPKNPLNPLSEEQAAKGMCSLLTGLIKAMVHRGECVIPLSGGYDSRLLLACAKPVWDKIKFITLTGTHLPHHDLSIPRKITKRFGLDYTVFETAKDNNYAQALLENVGNMYSDLSLLGIKAECMAIGDRMNHSWNDSRN